MLTKAWVIAIAVAVSVPVGHAQESAAPAKNSPVIAAANALGLLRGNNRQDLLNTLRWSGAGMIQPVGAQPMKLQRYTMDFSYAHPGLRVDIVRLNAAGAPEREVLVVAGTAAWNEVDIAMEGPPVGKSAEPAPMTVNDRLLEVWMTPHGVIKAAMAAGAKAMVTTENGRSVISVPVLGTTIKATLDSRNLPERVDAQAMHSSLGRVNIEITYSGYKDFDFSDILQPSRIVRKIDGRAVLDVTATEAFGYNPYVVFPVPPNVRQAFAQKR